MNATSDRCLRELKFDAEVRSVAWSPDGTRLAIGDNAGGVEVLTAGGRQLWRTIEDEQPAVTLSWSFDGSHLVVAHLHDLVVVYEAAGGRSVFRHDVTNTWTVSCSPKDSFFAARRISSIVIIDLRKGEQGATLNGHIGSILSLAWSPDGERLASGSGDRSVRTWDPKTERCVQCLEGHEGSVRSVSWSPDGERIASSSSDRTVRIWKNATGRCRTQCTGHQAWVSSVAWSPSGNVLASTSGDTSVRLWDPETGREIHRLEGHTTSGFCVAFSPDGTRLASASNDQTVRIWDVTDLLPRRQRPVRSTFDAYVARQTATVGRRPGTTPRPAAPLPLDLRPLPVALAQLTRLGIGAPCSHVRDLLRLTAGTLQDAEPLASHAGIRRIVKMRWPTAARVGLVALLLRPLPRQDPWRLPDGLSPTALRDALAVGLAGEAVRPEAPPLPVAALLKAVDVLDQRLLTLLDVVGAEAVADDPSLPLRLLPQVPKLPSSTTPQRRLLGLRLRLERGGTAHGHGGGLERAGIDVRGDLRSIVPWQLALPEEVFRGRYVRNELLYRARAGEEPPRLRPAVVVLDVSPPVFGPVEKTTRLAAHVVASSLIEARLPVVLVTAAKETGVRILERQADLVGIWTERCLVGADEPAALRVAAAMRETMADGVLKPVIVVLSHVFFGADYEVPEIASLRGLFVDYPGRRVRPPLSAACERWDSVAPGELQGLGERLGRLVG